MPKYNVWQAYMEQWDKDNIDPPDLVVEARNPSDAAIEFATQRHVSPGDAAMIVQEDGTDKYFEIELEREWVVDMYKPTTLEELCSP